MKKRKMTPAEQIEAFYADLVKAGQGEWRDLQKGVRVFVRLPLPKDPTQRYKTLIQFFRIHKRHFPDYEDFKKRWRSAIPRKEFN